MKIVINEPETRTENGVFRVIYDIDDCGERKELFYEVDEQYADGVTAERGDGVLASLFLYAMKKHADIEIKIPVSERLLYQLEENIMDGLHEADPSWEKIKISCPVTTEPIRKNHDAPVVATGMSCGVDSLCVYYTHNILNTRYDNHRVNLLLLFNVGAFTYGNGKQVEEGEYEAHRQMTFDFARDASGGKNLPVLVVNSNLDKIFPYPHDKILDFRNGGTVLLFQKLIDIYYFASAYRLDQFHVSPNIDTDYYSLFILPNLSTDSVTICLANSSVSRLRKTKLLTEYDLAKKYLNVCTAGHINCGQCAKCVRTLLSLDALGKLDEFSGVFDINAYRKRRAMNIGYAWASRRKIFYDEIYLALKKRKMLGISAFPWFLLFTLAKPVEYSMRKLPLEKRLALLDFAKRIHFRVPY